MADDALYIPKRQRPIVWAVVLGITVIVAAVLFTMGDGTPQPAPGVEPDDHTTRGQATPTPPPDTPQPDHPAPDTGEAPAPDGTDEPQDGPAAGPGQDEPPLPAPDTAAIPATMPTAATPGNAEVVALIKRGRELEQAGKRSRAAKLYEEALQLDPNSAVALSRLAFGHLNRGKNKLARDHAARAVAIDPTSSEGWIVLGAARHALGDMRGAREAYRQCVERGTGAYVQECRRMIR